MSKELTEANARIAELEVCLAAANALLGRARKLVHGQVGEAIDAHLAAQPATAQALHHGRDECQCPICCPAQPSMAPKICQAGRDGECNWAQCPQRDDRITERHCPLDVDEDDERPVTQPATVSETDLSDFDEPSTEQTVGDATSLRRNEKKP